MRKNKVKKILLISLVVLLAIGTLGMSLAFFGKDDFTWVKNKVEDAFVQEETPVELSNNVVLNSNFAINTTDIDVFDESSIVESGKFNPFIDNWKVLSFEPSDTLDFTAYQTDDGFYVRNDGVQSFWILQAIEEGIVKYADKEMTVSFSVNDVVYSGCGVLTDQNSVVVEDSSFGSATLVISLEQNQCRISLEIVSGVDATINWVQVEEGNVFTGYVAPTTDAVA